MVKVIRHKAASLLRTDCSSSIVFARWRRCALHVIELAVTVHQCLNGRAPPYLSEHCIPVSSADTRRHLRSANRHLLAVPRFPLNTYGRRTFSVGGPMAWNSLPDFIRDPTSIIDCLGVYLKRTCSRVTSASSAFGVLTIMRYTNPRTHSLTHATRLKCAAWMLTGFSDEER